MISIKAPNPLKLEGNLSENWIGVRFKRELENFLTATEKDKKPPKVKVAILQTHVGDDGIDLLDSFQLREHEFHCVDFVFIVT